MNLDAINCYVVVPIHDKDCFRCPECGSDKFAVGTAEVDVTVRPPETKGWICVCDCGREWFQEVER